MDAKFFPVNMNTTERLELNAKFASAKPTDCKHSIDTESMCIATNQVVVGTANRSWAHCPNPAGSSDPCTQKMIDADSIATTQKLLDRAIVYAWYTMKSERRPPALTRTRWLWRLAGAYHSSRHTSRLMEEAREHFAASGRWILSQWAAQKAREEAGHDQLALLDIQSMGYEAEAVVQALVPPAATAWVDYFTQIVQAPDPIACVGFSYVSERLGAFQGEEYIQKVEALLPPDIHATRWLHVHSSVGAEVKHVEETVKVVAELTPQERTRVADACYETALLRFKPPQEDYISDEELQNVLKPLESRNTPAS